MDATDATPHATTGGDAGGWPAGWTVTRVAETGSTNDDLAAAAATLPDRSVLVADHQTAGRGRLTRRWDAPPGANLLVSLLFHRVPERPAELTHRVALAAVDACREVAGVEATLKWPNDVMVGDAKLAGILAQRVAGGPVVVGLGLNVAWAPPGAARLGGAVTPPSVLRALLAAYDRLPADVTDRYRDALATLGRRVRVETASGTTAGTAIDIEPDGALSVVDDGGMRHRFEVGDVVHLR